MKTSIIRGSLGALAAQSGKSLAETFLSADVVILVDTSGSMGMRDSRGGRTRYDVACEELATLQSSMPGKIALINFSSFPQFEPSGKPQFLCGGTDLASALRFARVADVPGMRFILISDGQPDEPDEALREARQYTNRIDVIYVGPENLPSGRDFLAQLARVSGGQAITADRARELGSGIRALLAAG